MRKLSSLIVHPVFASVVFVGSLWVVNLLLEEADLSMLARLSIAVLPVPAFLFWVWMLVQWYKRADELWQRILLTTWVYAFVSSVLGALILYYVQKAGFLPPSEYPKLDYWGDVLPVSVFIGFLLGYFRATRRYK